MDHKKTVIHDFSYWNEKCKTIQSLLNSKGKLNTRIISKPFFKSLGIYQKIIHDSQCLDKFGDIRIGERIHFLLGNSVIEKCNVCQAEFIFFKCSQRRFSLCNHHQLTEHSHEKRKESRKKSIDFFVDSLKDRELFLPDNEFFQRIDELVKKPENFPFIVTQYCDLYHDLILRTAQIMPVNVDGFEISKRVFMAANRIFCEVDIPKCKACNNKVKYVNRIIGFSEYCEDCSLEKSNDTRFKNICEDIDNAIDHSKYEVVHYPTLLNTDFLWIKCKKCGKISRYQINNGRISLLSTKYLCRYCEKPIGSYEEAEVLEFIESFYFKDFIHGVGARKIIPPNELDFYFPHEHLAIEYNGVFWHSHSIDENIKLDKHVKKTNLCSEKGIRLLHLFSDEWNSNKDVCKAYIRHLLLRNENQIVSRPVKVVKLEYGDATKFHQANNLAGSVKTDMNYGIESDGKLVLVLSFKKSKKREYGQYELCRISYDLEDYHTNLIQKAIFAFCKEHNPTSILCYWDRRFPQTVDLKSLGFEEIGMLKPKFWYTDSQQRFNRNIRLEHLLSIAKEKLQDCHVSNLCQNDILKLAGIRKVYDCGTTVYLASNLQKLAY